MKNKKLLILALTLALLICGVFSVIASAHSNVGKGDTLASSSWIATPEKTLVKCPGGACDHTACYDYSFAVVGDTQNLNRIDAVNFAAAKQENPSLTYEEYEAAYMRTLYNWIFDNQDDKNIQYVMGLGDITESFNTSSEYYGDEWGLAKEAISLLDGKIGYSLVRGNHDISSGLNEAFGGGTAYYNSIATAGTDAEGRPMAAFRDPAKIEDSYRKVIIGEGENAHKYIIFTLEYYPTDATVAWLNETLGANSDYNAIITLHAFLGRDATFLDPNETTTPEEDAENDNWKEVATGGNVDPRSLWENSLSLHSNVKMILSGHVDVEDIVVNQLKGKNGNTVTCMLIDGQTIDKSIEPVGMVAMFYVGKDGTILNVEYVSTVRDEAEKSAYLKDKNQFEIKLDYGTAWTETDYGAVPTELFNKYEFSLFLDDESAKDGYDFYYGGYDSWDAVLTAINSWTGIGGLEVSANKTFSIVLNGKGDGKYTYTPGTLSKTTGRNPAKVVVDLNGNEFTITSGPMFYYYNRNNDRTPKLVIKNGDIVMSGKGNVAIFNNEINNANQNGSILNLDLEDLEVIYSGSNASIVKNFSGNAYDSYVNLNVTDCDFDLSSASGAVTLFALDGDNDNNDVTLNLIGGSVKGTTLANTILYTLKSERDTASFVKNDSGKYTSIILNENTAPTGDYRNKDGNLLAFATKSTAAPYEFVATVAAIEETPYGNINLNDYPLDSYPFVVFNTNKEVVYAINSWTTLISTMDSKYMNNSTDKYFVVMRKSMTANNNYSNWATFQGTCVIDLCGNILTVEGNNLFKPNKKKGKDTVIEMKNGNILMTGSTMLIYYASQTGGSGKFDISFTDINISYDKGATRSPLIQGMAGNADVTTTAKYTFTNCTIDMTTNAPSTSMVFANLTAGAADVNTGKTNHVAQIVVDGGTIKANNTNLVFAKYNSGEDSVTFTKKNGVLTTTVTVPDGTSVPSSMLKVNGDDLASVMLTDDSAQDVYQLCDQVMIDGYAKIPIIFNDTEKYPFIIFKNGKFKKACEDWYTSAGVGAIKDAIGVASASGDVITIVMRRDYYHNNSSSHCGDFYKIKDNATVSVDLGGHNLYSVRELMKFNLKTNPATINVNVSNGSIIVTSRALAGFSTQDSTNKQTLNLKFSNVDIIYRSVNNSTQYGKIFETDNANFSGAVSVANVTFEKCTFDFSEMKLSSGSSYTMFICDTDSKLNNAINIVLDGGTIIGNAKYKLTLATLNTETATDTLKFSKDSGSYTVFKLPSTEKAPTNVYNSTELAFVNVSSDGAWTTYNLMPAAAVSLDFTPKTSITLGSELVYNVYVPVVDNLKSYTVDGKTYANANIVTLDDGNQYYHIAVPMPASEAANSIVLKAIVTIGGKDYNGTFTMSIPKYSKKVLESNSSDVEKTLVKDVLAYIKAAYVYFDADNKTEVVNAIDEILGDYNSAFIKTSGETNTENGLWGVVIVLDAKPSIRFVLPEGVTDNNYTFKSGSTTLKYTPGTMTIGDKTHNYAEVSLYAYQLIKEITYSDGTNSGSYHINSYYDFVTTNEEHKNDTNLIALVEKLYNYCKSAEAYRASVTSK